jgi:multidrug/hemolysin transport system ATP-binding protein
MENAIEVKGLVKNYGEVKAVRGIDFYVKKGKLFAFLGPNGASWVLMGQANQPR